MQRIADTSEGFFVGQKPAKISPLQGQASFRKRSARKQVFALQKHGLLLTNTATSIQQHTAKIASYFERDLLAIFTLDENPKNAENSVMVRQKILTDGHRFFRDCSTAQNAGGCPQNFYGFFRRPPERLSGCRNSKKR